MEENKNKPKLRFPGFTDAWEQRKLKQLAIFAKGQGYSKNDLTDVGTPIILYGRLYTKYQSTITEVDTFAVPQSGSVYSTGEEVIVPASGETAEDIARASAVVKSGFLLGGDLNIIYPNKDISTIFLALSISNGKQQKELSKKAQGKSVVHLHNSDLEEVTISFPCREEQERIGGIFAHLDNLITLHQRKLNHLQDKKKALLQKMFPKNGESFPELRFPGFTDAWEQRKWIDTVDISTNMVDPRTGNYNNLPHIGPGNIESFTGRLLDNVNTVKEDNLISGKFHFNQGDVIYGKINPQLGKYVYAPYEGLSSADAYVLNAKNGLDQTFLFTLLQTPHFFKYSVSVSMRSGMPKINRDELNAYNFMSPCEREQEQIGKLFLNLNNLITLHQRKLNHLKEQKKALLQQMFV
ncbi:hypothetical protein NL50_10405 [Clostridium acetobutylicum]|nr:hypothetical protein NL50_10405 [Clostridium acetobutylicum]